MGLWDKIKDGLTTSKGEIADAAKEAAEKAQQQADAAREKAEDAAKDAGTDAPTGGQGPQPTEAPKVEPKAAPKAAPKAEKPAQPKKKFKEYTVVSGDTLSEIGARFGVSYMEIARLNNIENPDLIFPGQVFKIPND